MNIHEAFMLGQFFGGGGDTGAQVKMYSKDITPSNENIVFSCSFEPKYVIALAYNFDWYANNANYVCHIYKNGTNVFMVNNKGEATSNASTKSLVEWSNGTLTVYQPSAKGLTGNLTPITTWYVIAISDKTE